MTEDVLPADVQQFIVDYIDSIAHLEALLLFNAGPDIFWSAAGMAQRLYIPEKKAGQILAHLHSQGFLRHENAETYAYAPRGELKTLVEKTSQVYAQYLLPVTHLIHEKSRTRIQEFADAFRIRKD